MCGRLAVFEMQTKRTDDDGGHEADGDHQRRPEAADALGAREVRRVPLAERHEAGAHLSGGVVSGWLVASGER